MASGLTHLGIEQSHPVRLHCTRSQLDRWGTPDSYCNPLGQHTVRHMPFGWWVAAPARAATTGVLGSKHRSYTPLCLLSHLLCATGGCCSEGKERSSSCPTQIRQRAPTFSNRHFNFHFHPLKPTLFRTIFQRVSYAHKPLPRYPSPDHRTSSLSTSVHFIFPFLGTKGLLSLFPRQQRANMCRHRPLSRQMK